jgi:hypothetical protein
VYRLFFFEQIQYIAYTHHSVNSVVKPLSGATLKRKHDLRLGELAILLTGLEKVGLACSQLTFTADVSSKPCRRLP